MASVKSNIKVCDCCEEEKVVRRLTLTDVDGILLDTIGFCDNCYQDREILISDKRLNY